MNIPEGKKITTTVIRKEQQKAIDLGKELEEQGFKFKGKGTYEKGNVVWKTGYKDDLDREFFTEVKIDDIKKEKPKRRKRIKPAKKNKKK